MENQNVKRGRGRPRVFSDEERKNHKTTYMLGKEWYCDVCKNGKNYTLAGKSCHLKTKKHEKSHDINFLRNLESMIRKEEGDDYWEEYGDNILKMFPLIYNNVYK